MSNPRFEYREVFGADQVWDCKTAEYLDMEEMTDILNEQLGNWIALKDVFN